MKRTETIVIGGGQAGLAMSRCLTDRGIGHVVLERGRIGERWLSERWDSARLLTPNWQSRLPGWSYRGGDPSGYMTMPEVARYLEDYARSFAAPIESGTTVSAVDYDGDDYRVTTDRGTWVAPNVVVATGACDVPNIPGMGSGLSDDIEQLVPVRYRNPEGLAPGGVLVVGASASGLQLADEISRSGRPVTLAVGKHIRLPRRYRGLDVLDWLEEIGLFGEEVESVLDDGVPRSQPSLQLVGSADRRTLDLGVLQDRGVRLAGRAIALENDRVRFAGDLAANVAKADAKLESVLGRIDEYIEHHHLGRGLPPAERIAPLVPMPAPKSLDLRAEGYGTVLWATGFRRRYPWLKVPVLDERGEIRHDRGIADLAGLYVLGLPFMRRRNSHTLDGVGADAIELTDHLADRLERLARRAA